MITSLINYGHVRTRDGHVVQAKTSLFRYKQGHVDTSDTLGVPHIVSPCRI